MKVMILQSYKNLSFFVEYEYLAMDLFWEFSSSTPPVPKLIELKSNKDFFYFFLKKLYVSAVLTYLKLIRISCPLNIKTNDRKKKCILNLI